MSTPEDKWTGRPLAMAVVAATLCAMVLGYALAHPVGSPGERVPAEGYLIDVNSADAPTLQLLPGVGPAMARRIIDERKTRPFTDAKDLCRVKGIGEKTVERIRPYARFGGGS